MNNWFIIFNFSVLFFISANAMELATPSQILSQSDIITLIAYTLVNTTQPGSLIDDPSSDRIADKQLLVALQNFAATNKQIHDIVYKLRCGNDKESVAFNCYFYTQMGSHVTTAAFMGTPWALNIILDTYLKKLEDASGKKTAIEELNKQFGAHSELIPLYGSPQFAFKKSTPGPIGRNKWERSKEIIGYDFRYEPIIKTIAKFPPSTRQFILSLISDKK